MSSRYVCVKRDGQYRGKTKKRKTKNVN